MLSFKMQKSLTSSRSNEFAFTTTRPFIPTLVFTSNDICPHAAEPRLRSHSHILENKLKCQSPQHLVALLKKYLCSDAPNLSHGPLNILDGAAGNGRVGAELRNQLANDPAIDCLVGTDLLPSARVATLRDRVPNPYDEYIVANLIEPSEEAVQQFKRTNFEVVLMCAALGPGDGDLPLEVVDAATRFLDVGGLLALTVNEKQQGPKGLRREVVTVTLLLI